MSPVYANATLYVRPKPADIRLERIRVSKREVDPGESVEVWAHFSNPGGPGEATVSVSLLTESFTRTLSVPRGGGEFYLGVLHAPMEPQAYSVDVVPVAGCKGNVSTPLTVRKPPKPEIKLTGFSVSPEDIDEGDSSYVSFTLENTGNARGSVTYAITEDGRTIRTETVFLDPGEKKSVGFSAQLTAPGMRTLGITVNGVSARKTITVREKLAPVTESTVILPVSPPPPGAPPETKDGMRVPRGSEVQVTRYRTVRFVQGPGSDYSLRFDPHADLTVTPGKKIEFSVFYDASPPQWVSVQVGARDTAGNILDPLRERMYHYAIGFTEERIEYYWKWDTDGELLVSVKKAPVRYVEAPPAPKPSPPLLPVVWPIVTARKAMLRIVRGIRR